MSIPPWRAVRQKADRVEAHILVCFLAYVVWRTLGRRVSKPGWADGPRRLVEQLGGIRILDVVLPTRDGTEIRHRCGTRPDDHQAILLQRLGLNLPSNLPLTANNTSEM